MTTNSVRMDEAMRISMTAANEIMIKNLSELYGLMNDGKSDSTEKKSMSLKDRIIGVIRKSKSGR